MVGQQQSSSDLALAFSATNRKSYLGSSVYCQIKLGLSLAAEAGEEGFV